MLVCLLVEVDMFSVFPYYGLAKKKTLIFDIKFHDSYLMKFFVLFDLILYVPSTIFQLNRDGSSWVEPVLS